MLVLLGAPAFASAQSGQVDPEAGEDPTSSSEGGSVSEDAEGGEADPEEGEGEGEDEAATDEAGGNKDKNRVSSNLVNPAMTAGPVGPGAAQQMASSGGFRLIPSLSTSVGQGSFVANQHARNAYVDWSFSITPMYSLLNGALNLSGSFAFMQELTDSDGDTYNQRVLLSDANVGASHLLFTIPYVDVAFMVGARAFFPTSLASQTQTLLVGLRGNIALMRTFGPVTLSYNGSFRKNFHQYQSPVYDVTDVDSNTFIAREGGNERVDALLYTAGGNNISYIFSNSLSVNVQIIAGLSANISYQISNAFTYASYPKDSLASGNATAGRGQRDSFGTNISVSYAFPFVFLTLGLSNGSSPMSADNSHLRFPFWDFESQANNLSSIYLNAMSFISIDGSGVHF